MAAGDMRGPTAGEGAQTLTQVAYRAIRKDIIRGTRPPGERLRIEKLRQLYDIGPTPIREALQKLSTEQLVLAEGNRGFTVAPLDFNEFTDMNLARTEIELVALRRSIVLGDDAWEASVVAASYIMAKEDAVLETSEAAVPDSWEEANAAFHTALVAACGSRWLMRVRGGLQDLCERYRRASVRQRLGKRLLSVEHAQLSQAVLAREAERASDLLRRHFELTASVLTALNDSRS